MLVSLIGHPEWAADPRFATRQGWLDHLEALLRPAIEAWASGLTKMEACQALGAAGLAAGPCLATRRSSSTRMSRPGACWCRSPRTDGVAQPVLIPGNPVRMSEVPPSAAAGVRPPWLGEHTDAVLSAELGLVEAELASLREAGVIA